MLSFRDIVALDGSDSSIGVAPPRTGAIWKDDTPESYESRR